MDKENTIGDKPIGRSLGWELCRTERPFATPWMSLRRDEGHLADGTPFSYTYVEAAPAIFVVPVTEKGEVLLIRQYRYTIDAWCLEVPAGGTGDRPDQELVEVARDELQEEIGGTCSNLEYVGSFYPWHSRSDQIAHVFLAHNVRLDQETALERTEHIDLVPVPAQSALEMARRGEIRDGQSALAVLMCERLLRNWSRGSNPNDG